MTEFNLYNTIIELICAYFGRCLIQSRYHSQKDQNIMIINPRLISSVQPYLLQFVLFYLVNIFLMITVLNCWYYPLCINNDLKGQYWVPIALIRFSENLNQQITIPYHEFPPLGVCQILNKVKFQIKFKILKLAIAKCWFWISSGCLRSDSDDIYYY